MPGGKAFWGKRTGFPESRKRVWDMKKAHGRRDDTIKFIFSVPLTLSLAPFAFAQMNPVFNQ